MAGFKSVVDGLKTAYLNWEAGAEERAAKKIARAKTKAEREDVLHKLRLEKLERKRQVEEATAKASEAEARRRRAEKSIKQTGGSDIVSRLFGPSKSQTTARRRKSVRKSTRRKATKRR